MFDHYKKKHSNNGNSEAKYFWGPAVSFRRYQYNANFYSLKIYARDQGMPLHNFCTLHNTNKLYLKQMWHLLDN